MSKDTYERQMSAVIGKGLSDLEDMTFLRTLDPFQFDLIRRLLIDFGWECYLIGRKKGIRESRDANTTESRAVNS